MDPVAAQILHQGVVIPAHPLALLERKLDERRQAALTRYYCRAGAGGRLRWGTPLSSRFGIRR
jgi:hypothetical protein